MHNMLKMIWDEMKKIESAEKEKINKDSSRSPYYENLMMIKDLAKAYVYTHKACEIHKEHYAPEMDDHEMIKDKEKKSKIYD